MTLSNVTEQSSQETETTFTQNSEVKSAETENVELHASYYLEEIYIEENQYIEEGTNLIKYTNGEYLVAPYDCCITELNLPDLEGKCLNSHYIQLESTNVLTVSMKIDEEQIDNVKIGTEATIEVTAVGKTYKGYVTHIGSTASNGRFEIEIEFENDGDVKIGMTSSVEITLVS